MRFCSPELPSVLRKRWVLCSCIRQDAERFLHDLARRLNAFGLALYADRTRCIEFGRCAMANRRARDERRPETFAFLGFTHDCRTTGIGRFGPGPKPQAKRVGSTLLRFGEALRRRRHDDPEAVAACLRGVVSAWLQYFRCANQLPQPSELRALHQAPMVRATAARLPKRCTLTACGNR